MENDFAHSEAWRVKASIREAIRKLTDDKGADFAAEPAPRSQMGRPANVGTGETGH